MGCKRGIIMLCVKLAINNYLFLFIYENYKASKYCRSALNNHPMSRVR